MTLKIQTWNRFGLFALLMMLILSQAALAQTTAFSYQGKLTDTGNPANGSYDLQFRLFNALSSGNQVGTTLVREDVAVTGGIFIVTLDFGPIAFPGANRWLEISVRPGTSTGAFTALGPLQPISGTPYAIKSLSAAAADGLSVACVNCVTSGQIASLPTGSGNYIQNGTAVQASSNFSISGNGIIGGNLGIGTPAPATPLEVNGVLRSTRNGIATQYLQLWGGDSASIRLTAQSTAAAEKPLLIQNLSGEATPGVLNTIQFQLGTTAAPSTKMQIDKDGKVRIGISAFAGSKPMLEVADNGNAVGVYGLSSSNYGIYGDSSSSNGVVGISNTGDGVYGTSNSSYAGYFSGKMRVTGVIEKAGGGFKIDHPLDPENKYLVHSFVESPEMKNLYDGTVTTDANGEAEITLPDWFAALNRDFRYQLTCLGAFAQAIIAEKIKDNRFKIKTSLPNVEVSWQVTGTRQDAWANQNRLPVEEAKPEVERGFYQNPTAFGQPEERSLEWARHPEMMKQQKEQRERLQREQINKEVVPAARANNQ